MLPYDPAIPLLGIYPDKTLIQKDTCIPVFTAALFIAKTWKQPKCPSTVEWIKKMGTYIQWNLCCFSCCSVANLMDYSTSGSPALHCFPAFAQIHAHWVSDAIWSSHPLVSSAWNNVICSYMDEPRDYHTKQSKSERKRQIPSGSSWIISLIIN